jgi:hypothetical protein
LQALLREWVLIVYETEKGSAYEARSEVRLEAEASGTYVIMFVDAKPKGALKLVPRAALELAGSAELKATLVRMRDRLEEGMRP